MQLSIGLYTLAPTALVNKTIVGPIYKVVKNKPALKPHPGNKLNFVDPLNYAKLV